MPAIWRKGFRGNLVDPSLDGIIIAVFILTNMHYFLPTITILRFLMSIFILHLSSLILVKKEPNCQKQRIFAVYS